MTRWQGGFVRVGSGLRYFFSSNFFLFLFSTIECIYALWKAKVVGDIHECVCFKYPVMVLLHQRVRGMDERG